MSTRVYNAYITADGNLAFVGEENRETTRDEPREVDLTIYPEDVDHVIRGLFVQAHRRLGRTLPHKLAGVIRNRFSDRFKKHLEERRELIAEYFG